MSEYPPYYQTNKPMDVEHYFRLMVRQKWFILAPGMLGLVLAGALSLLIQNQYSARATILVERATLPTDFLRPTLPSGPETYVRSLVEQIKSSSSLEMIIKEFDLYPELRKRKALEEVVSFMRSKIIIENKANDTFSVQFQGESPEVVAKVTNRLTDMFIEVNLKYRLAHSTDNVAFLESEAQRLRAQVSFQEQQIQEFKTANIDRLPEQRNSTQLQLSSAQQRLQTIAESTAAALNRADSAQDRISLLREVSQNDPSGSVIRSPRDLVQESLEKERQVLESLLSQYSEKHPDVRRQRKEVETLEARLASMPKSSPSRAVRVIHSPEILRAQEEERQALAEVARLEAERKRLETLITTLSLRLEDTPRVALALQQLEQGLEVKRELADSWQKKATEATASLELERQNQGAQFRALDRAQLPTRPDSPNRPLIALMGAGLGLVLGIALVLGLDLLFRPFLDDNDLFRFTKVPVMVSIPHHGPFPSDLMRVRRQLANLMSLLLGALPGGARPTYAGSNLHLPPRARHLMSYEDSSAADVGTAPLAKKSTYLTGEVSEIDLQSGAAVLIQTNKMRVPPAAESPRGPRAHDSADELRRAGARMALRSGQSGENPYARPPTRDLVPFDGPLLTPPGLSPQTRGRPALPPLPDAFDPEQEAPPAQNQGAQPPSQSGPSSAGTPSEQVSRGGREMGGEALNSQSDVGSPAGRLSTLWADRFGGSAQGGQLAEALADGLADVPAIPGLNLGETSMDTANERRSDRLRSVPGDSSPMPGFGPVPTNLKTLADRATHALLNPEEESRQSEQPVLTAKRETEQAANPGKVKASSRALPSPSEAQGPEDPLEFPANWGIPKNWVVGPAWLFTGRDDAHAVTDGMGALRELELTPPWLEVEHFTRPSG